MAKKKYTEEQDKPMKESKEVVQNLRRGQKAYANFDEFWFKIKKEKNLDDKFKKIIWTHFKAAGFDKPELFENGLKHFGL